jgi:hypothetical protein
MRALLPTAANDEIVRQAYRAYREQKSRTAIQAAAQQLGCPRWQINKRARSLGLARIKEQVWSTAELAILERWAWCSDEVIARKLRAAEWVRTATAVHLKLKRLQLKAGIDGYSLRQLCEAFGLDHHQIRQWIKAGWLRGSRRQTARTEQQGGDMWYFPHRAVQQFALAHPDEIDLCKVEKWWFLDLITDGKIGCR